MELVSGIEGESNVRDYFPESFYHLELILDRNEPLLKDLLIVDVVVHRTVSEDAMTEGEVVAQLLRPPWRATRNEEDLDT